MSSVLRGLTAALNNRARLKFKLPEFSVDHLVVGGGVVGLAIARHLCRSFPSKTTYLVERHDHPGEETSSRNSEVIHSGLYYPPDSLKTRFCLRGRQLLYQYCSSHHIPHRKTGKIVVAHDDQLPYIENLHTKARSLKPPAYFHEHEPVLPTELISGDAARAMETNLSLDIAAALWCPETGIVDSHTLMESFESDITDSVYSTRIVRVDPAENGWVVQTLTGDAQEPDSILAHTLVNAAGLSAPFILNSILPLQQHIPMYFARGSYASYNGPGIAGISHLIYPCPETGPNAHAFHSLGTHLTIDLQGKVRFGPDLEWLSPGPEEEVDFWRQHLVPDGSRLTEMHNAVTRYLPEVSLGGMQTDYVGIRPKIASPSSGFQDFVIRSDGSAKNPMISLLGIESPGLTSCMALAEYVVEDLLKK
ncbi:NAD dehydrogenase [Armillaria borealis]|uniref:L-2-hydroxyglutarate dehydrogenase, mitochondrial n=1 Tax=Armillaria borealis TaxID=47425 RepID=A0AA39K2Q4_9AGAR|nr:NAD dehydrogenase [Armillaria borealis]